MIGTGWQIQDQYITLRGSQNASDTVGQQIARSFTTDELSRTWVIGSSRFDVTNVAIWADNAELTYDIFGPGSLLDAAAAPEGTKKIVVTGDLQVLEGASLEVDGQGYAIYDVD
jgi:BRCT domain type II-containing protein